MDNLNHYHWVPNGLPTHYLGKRIKLRVPYTMPAELIVNPALANVAFPDATFLHTSEKPFEVWGANLQATQSLLGAANFIPIAEPAPTIDKFWRLRINDVATTTLITKNAQLASGLKVTNTNLWPWKVPRTLERAEGFDVAIDNLLAANFLRAEVTFFGYLIVIATPSETR